MTAQFGRNASPAGSDKAQGLELVGSIGSHLGYD